MILRLIGVYYNCFFLIGNLLAIFYKYYKNGYNYFFIFLDFYIYYLWFILLYKIYINTDEFWIDIIINTYEERFVWVIFIILMYRYIF